MLVGIEQYNIGIKHHNIHYYTHILITVLVAVRLS